MSAKDDDFWNSGAQNSFNFDEEEEIPDNDDFATETATNPNAIFNSLSDEADYLPVHKIVSKKNLELLLDHVNITEAPVVLTVPDTIKKAFLGKPYVLSNFRSLAEKTELLNQAIRTYDGNVILSVILYLLKTLKHSIFLRVISGDNIALKHYEAYLRENNKLQELGDLYMGKGKYILDIFYLSCKNTNTTTQTLTKLEQFMFEFSSMAQTDRELQLLNDHILFLKWQIKNQVNCESAVEALALLCRSTWEKNREESRILEFRSDLKIGDFQLEWIYLNTMAVLLMWKRLTEHFIKPNWLTKKSSLKSVIDLDLIVNTLHKHQAPKKVLEDFLTCMVGVEKSIFLAKKWNCHRFVIDTYVNQKDRIALINYITDLNTQSEDFLYAKNALKTEKKWKN